MIKNQRQFRITRARAVKFQEDLDRLRKEAEQGDDMASVMADAVKGQLADFKAELRDYEQLQALEDPIMTLHSLADLPDALIRGRISLGLTQRELAERLDLKPQQIQRYEDGGYKGASLSRLLEITKALGLEVRDATMIPLDSVSAKKVLQRAHELGVETAFLKKRVAPPELFECAQAVGAGPSLELADRLSSIFGWRLSALLSDGETGPIPHYADAAAFRLRRKTNETRLAAYTHYARYLAGLAIKASPDLQSGDAIPSDPALLLRTLDHDYAGPNFQSVLHAMWDRGVIVLPMDDEGGFQGVAWRIRGRNVAVLNTRSYYASRWCHDLLHESYHLAQEPQSEELEVVELEQDINRIPDTEPEKQAEDYARHVELRGLAEETTAQAVQQAGGNVAALKRVLPAVARQANVEIGALANYVAWRLSLEEPPYNWWASAANLQRETDPMGMARDEFFRRVDVSRLNPQEQHLLIRGLASLEDEP